MTAIDTPQAAVPVASSPAFPSPLIDIDELTDLVAGGEVWIVEASVLGIRLDEGEPLPSWDVIRARLGLRVVDVIEDDAVLLAIDAREANAEGRARIDRHGRRIRRMLDTGICYDVSRQPLAAGATANEGAAGPSRHRNAEALGQRTYRPARMGGVLARRHDLDTLGHRARRARASAHAIADRAELELRLAKLLPRSRVEELAQRLSGAREAARRLDTVEATARCLAQRRAARTRLGVVGTGPATSEA